MSSLVSAEAKQTITQTIGAIEKDTSAEIVVTLQPRSGDYRRADFLFGAIVALGTLCVFLYHPEPFDFTFLPLEEVACFIAGAVACAYFAPLRRLLTPKRIRTENVGRSARSFFVEHGVDKTKGRTGILIYLSTLEREAILVVDRGIDTTKLVKEIEAARTALRLAVRKEDLEAFIAATKTFGAALARVHPVQEGDVDELSNEVAA